MKKKVFSILLTVVMIFGSTFCTQIASALAMRGDLNGDGKIDIKDYLILRKNLAKLESGADEKQLDCNGDNSFDINDVRDMAKYLVNLGELYVDREESWSNLIDWEQYSEGNDAPEKDGISIVSAAKNATFETKSLTNYKVENDKVDSKMAMALVSGGLAMQDSENGNNPTIGKDPSRISFTNADKAKLANATNLRVLLNIVNAKNEIDVIYIGFAMGSKKYYHKISRESYAKFNYFYFVGKEFTEYKKSVRRTYLEDDNPNTIVLTKDDVKNIKTLYFWLECGSVNNTNLTSNSNGNPLIIDDIDYYDGANGYDSTEEDNALPKPTVPDDDGTKKYIAISFDDGPKTYTDGRNFIDYYTDLAQEYNEKNNANAKFTHFLVGNELGSSDVSALKRAVAEGHELENHTKNHGYFGSYEDKDEYVNDQIKTVDDWLNTNVGVTTNYLRPPMLDLGASNKEMFKYITAGNTAGNSNIKACIGGYCPYDYNYTTVDCKVEYYKMVLRDGAIVLAHEHFIDNVETMRIIMDYFGKQGYEFVTIDNLFKVKGVTPELNKLYYVVE